MKADHKQVKRLLNTARGQIDGIIKMVDEDRYCIDIANQVMATDAILKKVYKEVIAAHMSCCIKESIENNDEEKLEEMIQLLNNLIK